LIPKTPSVQIFVCAQTASSLLLIIGSSKPSGLHSL
jgi:hypothetical protein